MILFFTLINNPLNYNFLKIEINFLCLYFLFNFIFMRIVKNNYLIVELIKLNLIGCGGRI